MKRPTTDKRSVLASALWGFRRELAWVGVFSFFANFLLLAPTLYMLQVFDRVLHSGSGVTLLALTAITVLLIGWMALAEWLRSRLLVRVGVRFDEQFNGAVFDAAFAERLAQPEAKSQRYFTDMSALRQFLTGAGAFAVFDTPWTPLYIAVLFLMHPLLGWTAAVFSVLMLGMAVLAHHRTADPNKRALEAANESAGFLGAKLRNAEAAEAMGMLGPLRGRWLARHDLQLDRASQAQTVSASMNALTKFVQYTQQSLMLAVAALLVIDGQIGMGAMIAANALMSNALRPMSMLVSTWKLTIEARDAYLRLDALLGEHFELPAHPSGVEFRGQVSVSNLVASAPRRATPILHSLSATFHAGEVVAIIGPSGAGKSTLARCLLGVWPDMKGEVSIDGRPVQAWRSEVFGRHVGYLPQDIELFEGTIAENIARFGPVLSDAVVAAATMTGIHEMVLRFPKGYDTSMGEAGALLSGGQRQRIGLARALYGNPKLVVLDEPGASLDDAGEVALLRAVQALRKLGATVFMVTHQSNLLSVADRALVLKEGEIVQFGPVAALSAPVPNAAKAAETSV